MERQNGEAIQANVNLRTLRRMKYAVAFVTMSCICCANEFSRYRKVHHLSIVLISKHPDLTSL